MDRNPPHLTHASQTLTAVALVILVAGMLSWMSRTLAVEVVAVAVAVAGACGWSRPLKLIPWIGLGMLLAGFFVLKWFFWPADPRNPELSLGQILAEFLLMAQAVQFVVKRKDRPLGPVFLLLGVGALLGAGLTRVNFFQNAIYQTAVLLFVFLLALYSALGRSRLRGSEEARSGLRATLLGLMLLVTGAGSVAGSMFVHTNWRDIESFLNQRVRMRNTWLPESSLSSIGFQRRKQSTLGSADLRKAGGTERIALRITGTTTPQYLRGGVFDKLEPDGTQGEFHWLTGANPKKLPATKLIPGNLPPLQPGERSFVLRGGSAPLRQILELWPEVESETLFTELNTSAFAAPVDSVRVDEHEVVEAADVPPGQGYRLFGSASPMATAITPEKREQLTEVPALLQGLLDEISAKVFTDKMSPLEKIAAVKQYFMTNYQYSLQVEVPAGRGAIEYFLKDKPPAYCEYFASATVLLLRKQGIPARYVYGYSGGHEYNHLGRYWIIRQKHAHAWTEAYLEGEGWQVVETTPAAGLPHSEVAPHVSHLWDNLLLKMRMVRALLSRGGGKATLQAAWILFSALFTTLPGMGVTAILSLIVWRILRSIWRKDERAGEVVSPGVIELRKLLAQVERRLMRRQLTRAAAETLNQFAQRLQQAALQEPSLQPVAEWYLEYAATRYGSEFDADQVFKLRNAAKALALLA